MGLDAFVSCTCYRDGRTTEPPIPRDQIVMNEDGQPEPIWERLPHSQQTDYQREASSQFAEWNDHGCEHEFMELVSERIGNISGVAWLRETASDLDPHRFATLSRVLTGLSGLMNGSLPVCDARAALPEIEALLGESTIGSTRMIQEIDGHVIDDELDWGPIDYTEFRTLGPYPGEPVAFAVLVELGVQGYDFVVRPRGTDSPDELFRARLVDQRWDDNTAWIPDAKLDRPVSLVTFSNVETGEEVTVRSFGVSTRLRWPNGSYWDVEHGYLLHYPRTFFIGERKVMVTEIYWRLTTVQRLFTASVETGNPVVWC